MRRDGTHERGSSGGGVNGTSSERSSLLSSQFSCYLPFSGYEQTKLPVSFAPFPRPAASRSHTCVDFSGRAICCADRAVRRLLGVERKPQAQPVQQGQIRRCRAEHATKRARQV